MTDATIANGGTRLYVCTATNTWTQRSVASDDNTILVTSTVEGQTNLRLNPSAGGSGTVTNAAALTANALMVGDGVNAAKVLASLGTSGQVLTSNGPATPPSFQAAAGGGVTITGKINYVPYQFNRVGEFSGVASTGYCVLVPIWATTTFSQVSFMTGNTASSTQSVAIYSNSGTLLISGNATTVSGFGAQIPITATAISGSVYVCHTANVIVAYQLGGTWDWAFTYNAATKLNYTAVTSPTLSGTYTWPASNTFTAIAGINGGSPMMVSMQN